jgi:hypothetical protein
MSLQQLSQRSSIPTATARYGVARHPKSQKKSIYDGQFLPKFLQVQGGDSNAYRAVLKQSRIGSVFDELTPGRAIVIVREDAIAKHPEA